MAHVIGLLSLVGFGLGHIARGKARQHTKPDQYSVPLVHRWTSQGPIPSVPASSLMPLL